MHCPNCNTQLPEETQSCHNCGAALSQPEQDGEVTQQGQESHQQSARPSQSAEETKTAEDDDPLRPEEFQQESGGQQPGPLNRRQTLIALGGIGALIAGWFVFLGDPNQKSPETILREYVNAVEKGDPDAASTLVHQDSPSTDQFINAARRVAESKNEVESFSLTVESITEVSRDTDPQQSGIQEFVTLELTMTAQLRADGDTESESNTAEYQLGKNSAALWKLWDTTATSATIDTS